MPAREFEKRWGNNEFAPPEPRDDALFVAVEHDNGWCGSRTFLRESWMNAGCFDSSRSVLSKAPTDRLEFEFGMDGV